MIIVYPMLVSKAVSENVVPGIAKTLESYMIVNAQDTIMTDPIAKKNFNFKIKGGKFFAKEDQELTEDITSQAGPGTKNPTQRRDDATETERQAREDRRKRAEHKMKQKKAAMDIAQKKKQIQKQKDEELERSAEKIKQKEIDDAKKAKATLKIQDNKALSIEPSFMTVEVTDKYGNSRNEFLGIKVVPFRVKSDAKLSRLILHDVQMKAMNASMVALGRRVMRWFYKLTAKWSDRLRISGLTPSGDPRRDILMGRTGHKGQGFIVLSKTEDIDEHFLSNVQQMNRLFRMGWGNIVIVDDINRVAYFCMKKFKGVCTAISFAMMYQNFGQLKVYDSLEDARRQNSSLFKIHKRLSKVVSEWITEHRRDKYMSEGK